MKTLTPHLKAFIIGLIISPIAIILMFVLAGSPYWLNGSKILEIVGSYNYLIGPLLPISIVIVFDYYRSGIKDFFFYLILVITYFIFALATLLLYSGYAMSRFNF